MPTATRKKRIPTEKRLAPNFSPSILYARIHRISLRANGQQILKLGFYTHLNWNQKWYPNKNILEHVSLGIFFSKPAPKTTQRKRERNSRKCQREYKKSWQPSMNLKKRIKQDTSEGRSIRC